MPGVDLEEERRTGGGENACVSILVVILEDMCMAALSWLLLMLHCANNVCGAVAAYYANCLYVL